MAQNEDIELIKKHLSDVYWRLNNLYYIKDKDGRRVLFKFNDAQEKFFHSAHNKNLILKARQKGFSTYGVIKRLDKVLFNSYVDAGIIAHTVDDAEKIFTNKVRFAYDNLPQWLKNLRIPNTDRAGELRFPNGSSISVSAGYRGGTLVAGLHVSEYGKICAKYPEKAKEIKSGALNAVPLEGDVDFESTAESMSGDFFEMCNRSMLIPDDELTPMDFKFHFFPWFDSIEYRLNPAGIVIPQELLQYFKMLKDDHSIDLDDAQKAWYFKKSEEQGDEMHQEYPSYPEEAFLASGRPVFKQQDLARDIKKVRAKKAMRGFLDDSGKFEENPLGTIVVFKMPVKEDAYSIGADPAEGLETGDNSAASVLDKNFNQCAVYAGKMDPDTFGKFLVKIAKFYNNAVIAPEVNNHGHAVLQSIKNEKYYKVYRREVKEELGIDIQDKVGWLNNVKTKMQMIDELKASYRDGSLTINDEATLREMMTVVIEEDGNIYVNGKDRVVALCISIQAIKQASIEGEHKAYTPNKTVNKDITTMTVEEKLKYYKRKNRHV
jgi:hypothetical protein